MKKRRHSKRRHPSRRSRTRKARRLRGGQAPPALNITFPSGVTATDQYPIVPFADVQGRPRVEWDRTGPKRITFLCYDPDAPAKSWLHWLVVNCQGTNPSSGETLVPWAPPSPPKGTGTHRYIFNIAEQVGELADPIAPPLTRASFSPEDFYKLYDMTSLSTVGIRVNSAEGEA